MKTEIIKLRSEIEPLLGAVQRLYETSVGELRALNETWKQNAAATIPEDARVTRSPFLPLALDRTVEGDAIPTDCVRLTRRVHLNLQLPP